MWVPETATASGSAQSHLRTCWSQRWAEVSCPAQQLSGEVELEWLDLALGGQASAVVWTATQGLVAPLSYRRHTSLEDVRQASAERGWPVRLRRSGGGVVPQGPGILNITLAYPCRGTSADYAESVYDHLCGTIATALATLDIDAVPRKVDGSFCDGRFNLAVLDRTGPGAIPAGVARKIAGTAQYWRSSNGTHAVLAHALLLVDGDTDLLTAEANRFETALGSGRTYDAAALTSVAQAWAAAHPGSKIPTDLSTTVARRIAESLMQ